MKLFPKYLLLLCLPIFISCGDSAFNEGEDYGNLLDSPGGLIVLEEEHTGGWMREDCTTCHNLENIHLVNRTGIDIDIEAIHEQALEEGLESCAGCHGTNGVE